MMKKYYVANPEGQQEGPYDKDELNSQVLAGKHLRGTLVWAEGMAEWEPIENHFTMPATPPPLPTMPATPPPLPTMPATPPPPPIMPPPLMTPVTQEVKTQYEINNSIDWNAVSKKFWTLYGRISPKTFAKQAIVLLLISAVALVLTCTSIEWADELPHGHVPLPDKLIFIGTIICAITSGIVFLLCFGGILTLGIRRSKDSGYGGVVECFIFLIVLGIVGLSFYEMCDEDVIEVIKLRKGYEHLSFNMLFFSLYVAAPYVVSSMLFLAFLYFRQPQLHDNQYGPCVQQDNAQWIQGKINSFSPWVVALNFCFLWSFGYWGYYSNSVCISSAIYRADEDMLIRCIDAGADVELEHLTSINHQLEWCHRRQGSSYKTSEIEALERMQTIILQCLND